MRSVLKTTAFYALVAAACFTAGNLVREKYDISEYRQPFDQLQRKATVALAQYAAGSNNSTAHNKLDGAATRRRGNKRKSSTANIHHDLLHDTRFMLNDRTLRLSPFVDHLWLHNGDLLPKLSSKDMPSAKIVLTDFGWNQVDQVKGLKFTRSIREKELMQGVIDHPLFDPTFHWSDTMERMSMPAKNSSNSTLHHPESVIDPNIRYYVFLDLETCFDSNYPNYVSNFEPNADREGGRAFVPTGENDCFFLGKCSYVQKVLESPLFQQNPNTTKLIFFSCRGNGPDPNFRGRQQKSPQLSIVSLSASTLGEQVLKASDMGQPPPPIKPSRLTYDQRHAIETCEAEKRAQRPYWLTFVGTDRLREARTGLFQLHNGRDIIALTPKQFIARNERRKINGKPQQTYQQVMEESVFAATPRGDNLFSYRFTEVLSAGAIPVVYADGWQLPFRSELVDWKFCAVVIPEQQVNQTVRILKSITQSARCKMRQRCYEIYQRYMANGHGTIAGIIETFEVMAANNNNSRNARLQ